MASVFPHRGAYEIPHPDLAAHPALPAQGHSIPAEILGNLLSIPTRSTSHRAAGGQSQMQSPSSPPWGGGKPPAPPDTPIPPPRPVRKREEKFIP